MITGALAFQRASTSGTGLPSTIGRSRNIGGLAGFGDQAAADASTALEKKSAAAIFSGVSMRASASTTFASGGGPGCRQHGLMMYSAEKTPGAFIATRIVP